MINAKRARELGTLFLFMHESAPGAEVDMLKYTFHQCGTIACHAGWFAVAMGKNQTWYYNYESAADEMAQFLGFGNHKFAEKRAKEVLGMLESAYCLKKNKNGSPAHPLYISADSPLTIFKESRPHLEGDLKGKTFVYLAPDGKTFSLWQKHYIWHKWIPKTLGDYAKAYKKMVPEWKNGPCFWGMGDECPDDLGYKFVGFLADQGCD